MAKSKKTLIEEFVALGGDPVIFPDDLEQITAAEIQEEIDKIEAANLEAAKLKAQLEEAGASSDPGEQPPAPPAPEKTEADTKDKEQKQKPKDKPPAAPKKSQEPVTPGADDTEEEKVDGVKFTLTGAASWSSGRLPGKRYAAGVPFTPETDEEAAILRASGRFKVKG